MFETIVEMLQEGMPHINAVEGLTYLVKTTQEIDAIKQIRERLFLCAINYRQAGLLEPNLLERWCLRISKQIREQGESIPKSNLWLQRAQYLGISESSEYKEEKLALDRILNENANVPSTPPYPTTKSTPDKFIGNDEKGHLNIPRLTQWAEKLYRLHPYVQEVRRVRKDPNIAQSASVVLDGIPSIHLKAAEMIDESRLIAAVLDSSYSIPAAAALRINIILAEGTKKNQRQTAIELLKNDSSLFENEG